MICKFAINGGTATKKCAFAVWIPFAIHNLDIELTQKTVKFFNIWFHISAAEPFLKKNNDKIGCEYCLVIQIWKE